MEVATGVVVNGKIEVHGDALPEGTQVVVLLPSDLEAYELSPGEAAEIDNALEEIRMGKFVGGDAHLASLRSRV